MNKKTNINAGDIVTLAPRAEGDVQHREGNDARWEVISIVGGAAYLRLTTDHTRTCGAAARSLTVITEGK
jgi:hypothetical protein